jgi:hypothetical protein
MVEFEANQEGFKLSLVYPVLNQTIDNPNQAIDVSFLPFSRLGLSFSRLGLSFSRFCLSFSRFCLFLHKVLDFGYAFCQVPHLYS